MKLKSLTLILAVALGAQVAFAQQSKTDSGVEFRPHWYGQIQGGAAYTVGETAWKDLISPAGALSFGYQFNPVLGLRFGASGWQGMGATVGPKELYKFNFVQGNVDLTLNLANLFGYNHKRILNPYALIGGGAAFAFNNGAKNVKAVVPAEYFANLWDKSLITPAFRYGLGTDIRLSDRLALNLEVNGNMLSDKFNSKDAPNPDYQYNALIGLKYVFGGKPFRTSAKYLADVAAAEAAAAALKAQKEAERLAAEKAAAEKAAADKAAADKLAAEKAAAEAAADANRYAQINTFFELDSDVISDEEAAKLVDFIQWLNKYNRSVAICGYADVQTGRPKYNMGLSSRRVENVKAFLVEHGVDASRISTDFKGDTVQPFEQNELNRVVIGTVEK